MIVRIKCGWCRGEFETENAKGEDGYGVKQCPHCRRIVSSSKKEPTGKLVGRKHIHTPLKNGDVV